MPDCQPVAARLNQLAAAYAPTDPVLVGDIIRSVLSTMRGDLTSHEVTLLAEVESLAQTVANARQEIVALQPDVITASHIPAATDELDAIVAHTAAATNSILECCESLDTLGPTLSGDASATLQDVTTRIYEACSFQDITGQRITKIVATLKSIESKVGNIIRVFSRDGLGAAGGEAPEAAPAEEAPAAATLLNGPQLPSNAMDQSDIDALLAELG